ncbi:MAG: DNA adenine methylase, partial [Spirochaetales bacterium]|nr:DNA adenine methylase [Spirochaetales bacterium]
MSSIETTILSPSNKLYEYKPELVPINYPLIRYMGSKYRLLDWINSELSQIDFNTVLDGFSGSGAVSYMLKKMNKTVYTNDFLYFSYILAKAT